MSPLRTIPTHPGRPEAGNDPAGRADVFLYCHGGFGADHAASECSQLSLGVARALQGLVCSSPPQWPRINAAFAPQSLPIPWPSKQALPADPVAQFMDSAAALEARADKIGQNAGLALLRSLLDRRKDGRPFRFNFIGHSLGCRVLCAALQAVTEDSGMLERLADSAFNVVLLQAAIDCDALEPGQLFGQVQRGIPRLRMLVTTLAGDTALGTWPHRIRPRCEPVEAMGWNGPTGNLAIPVDQCFAVTHAIVPTFTERLGVANLTLLHESLPDGSGDEARKHRRCDSHRDIYRPQIYDLLARFIGQ
jgi:hypothetical protein